MPEDHAPLRGPVAGARGRRILFTGALLAALAVVCYAPLRTDARPDKQSKEDKEAKKRRRAIEKEQESAYSKWIQDEVPYIITDEERDAWKKLTTDDEREKFIEAFWERRNPNPGDPENEYKEEYYRRIAYANEHYASGIPGWKTDRGRIYIMYGPPDEIDNHDAGGTYQRPIDEGGGETETFPFEDWTYNYIPGIGENVQLEFVDPTMSGEFHLTMDPGEKDALLHVPGAGLTLLESEGLASKADRFTRTDGMTIGTTPGGTSQSMNEFTRLDLYSKIFRPPSVKFNDLKESVSHRITSQTVPFQVRTDFIRVTEDTVLTPVTIQIADKDLEFQNKNGVMHAAVDIYGQFSTLSGRVATSFDQGVEVDMSEHDFQSYGNRKEVYQKALPLKPGRYKLSLVVKDENSGNIGATDLGIVVPAFQDDRLSSSSLILADLIQQLPTTQVGTGPFVIGGTKVRPSVGDIFSRSQKLGIYMQVYNLTPDPTTHRPSADIQYDLTKDGKSVFSRSEKAQTEQVTIEKTLPLQPLEPGRYTLEVKVTDNVSKQSVSPTASFQVQ
jgi:GWxTD domain-containing protein